MEFGIFVIQGIWLEAGLNAIKSVIGKSDLFLDFVDDGAIDDIPVLDHASEYGRCRDSGIKCFFNVVFDLIAIPVGHLIRDFLGGIDRNGLRL